MSRNGSREVEWIPAKEAARRIGVSLQTLYRLVNDGLLPAYQPARNLQFKADEVEDYIQRSKVQPGALDHLVNHRRKPSQ